MAGLETRTLRYLGSSRFAFSSSFVSVAVAFTSGSRGALPIRQSAARSGSCAGGAAPTSTTCGVGVDAGCATTSCKMTRDRASRTRQRWPTYVCWVYVAPWTTRPYSCSESPQ